MALVLLVALLMVALAAGAQEGQPAEARVRDPSGARLSQAAEPPPSPPADRKLLDAANRFQPSERIRAETTVPFPADI